MALNRRRFIQISAAGAGAATVGSGLTTDWWGMIPDEVHDPGTDGDRVVPTFCEMCFWKCGLLAHVKDGRVTKLEGNPDHPLSRGKLCPRGIGGTGLLYDPDRLRTPLIRREKRGDQVFDAVSWDDALNEVAEQLERLRRVHGAEALAMFSHGYGGSWFKMLMKGYGTPNVSAPSYAQCRGTREAGFVLTFGAPVGSPEATDIANARAITLIGSHLGENMHNTQVQDLARAIDRGAELVVVDPRFSTAAGKARWWLPIKPGTDLALLLAWMHVIVTERLYDRDYLERYAVGFPELAKHLEDKTPEWAFVHTGIPAATIVETARFIAGARPASLVHPGRRTAWYGDDTQRSRAIAILNALLGSWGRSGGFFLPTQLALPALPTPRHLAQHLPGAPGPADTPKGAVYPFASKVLAQGLCDATIPGTAHYDIRGWFVYGTNLLQSLPRPQRTREAIQKLDFLVVVDVLPADIAGWADVVLPEATYLERYDDLHNPPWREGFAALRQPVVEPMYQSRPGWWIAKQLAERLGHGALFDWADAEDYLQKRLALGGHRLSDFAATGVIHADPEPVTIEEGLEPTFDTPSGRIELYSKALAEVGLPPVPRYRPTRQPDPGTFRLLFGRAPAHTFGRTTNNRVLSRVFDVNPVWVNARVALELGLKSGDSVRLVNEDGVRSNPVPVRATQRIRPDCVYLVHGYGHESRGLAFAHRRGASDSELITRVEVDAETGGTGMNVNFVRLEKVDAGAEVA